MTDDEALAERVDRLEATVADLRAELGPPRGPLGLPRPPTPREALSITVEYGIPTAIAVLEANVRLLELLAEVLRVADVDRRRSDRLRDAGDAGLARLESALDDVQAAIQEGALPADPTARSLLRDARSLSDEIREELAREESPRPARPTNDAERVQIDVEDELRTIREEVDGDDGDEENG